MRETEAERAAVVALLRTIATGWPGIATEVLVRGSAVALLEERFAQRDTLFPTPERVDELLTTAATDLRVWQAEGIGVHTVVDSTYPVQLRDIRELPPILFTRGDAADDIRAIAVVGTRQPTGRGRYIAEAIATELARRQITVVSGLAAGVDTTAHDATLAAGGRTVAVIGTGIRRAYPATNQALQERIANAGMLVSQFWPDAPPRREHFPMRNAVMSGYAVATVVVEAGETSGTRSQARLALQHGRPVILLQDLLAHQWARSLAARPGVHVVSGLDELFGAVDDVLQQRTAELYPQEGLADFALV